MMIVDEKKIIEEVVNSVEAERMMKEHFEWDRFKRYVQAQLNRHLTIAEANNLEADLYDWWKNGNFKHWEDGEKNELFPDIGKWELGDPDFWP